MIIYNIKINGSKVLKYIGILIAIVVISLFIYSIYNIFHMAKNEGMINNPNDVSVIKCENYTNILKSVHDNLDNYIGKKISFTGYIYRVYDFDDDKFVLARDMVIDSSFQTVVVGFLCESKDAINFADGTWVNITGEIIKGNYHGEIPIIKISKIEENINPDKSLVYPPDDSYIQTLEI